MDPENAASAAVAHRIGMRRESLAVEDELVKGEWVDTLYYAMLEREFRSRGNVSSAPAADVSTIS